MMGAIIGYSVLSFTVGGIFGFIICALLVASGDERNGK